jgi:hypothetical protein
MAVEPEEERKEGRKLLHGRILSTPHQQPPFTLPEPTAPTLQFSSTIMRRVSRWATEEEDSEKIPTTSGSFVLGIECIVARIYCDGQYLYWAGKVCIWKQAENY